MKAMIIHLFVAALNVLYGILKVVAKPRQQIVFLSRQTRTISMDAKMLSDAIAKKHPEYRQIYRFRMLDAGLKSKIAYAIGLVGDMYYLAGAKAAICDTYSIPVSCLKQREDLVVIQMWHAMGAVKKFGWQSVGREDGRSEMISQAMHMHKGYSYVLAPSEQTGLFYQEAFRVSGDKIRVFTMPHMDFMMRDEGERALLEEMYPSLKGKKVALYVPTFREGEAEITMALTEAFDRLRRQDGVWELLVSLHPLSKMENAGDYAVRGGLSSMQLIKAADCVITDYSACIFEAACLKKQIFLYVPDLEEYRKSRGLNIDPMLELPELVCSNAEELCARIIDPAYPYEIVDAFAAKYVTETKGCTEKLAEFVIAQM